MADEVRRLTELLAHDPGNLAFRQLGELLRQRGDLDAAHKVAIRGLERHTLDSEAHALLARISVDRGELQRAFDEWDMALRLAPTHIGALKGLGFISYRWGRLDEAERYLMEAVSIAPADASVLSALDSVRRARESLAGYRGGEAASVAPSRTTSPARAGVAVLPPQTTVRATPAHNNTRESALQELRKEWSAQPAARESTSPAELFRPITGDSQLQAVLVDADGLVIAGQFISQGGADRAQDVGAELSGVGEEANRAMRHLNMGDWKTITFESESAVVAIARAGAHEKDNALVVLASASGAPPGLVKRVLERAQKRAISFLDGVK